MRNGFDKVMSVESRIYSTSNNVKTTTLPSSPSKCALLAINSYKNTKYALGNGPLNDGYHIAKCLTSLGFDCYSLIDGKKNEFLKTLQHFIKSTTDKLVVYYIGHGVSVADKDGDEADGKDEAMFFTDGPLIDDILVEQLQLKQERSKLVLVTDACHSGTIWDIQGGCIHGRVIPPNVMSISAANDKQTAKQTVIEKLEQGVFSYFLRKALRAKPTSNPVEVRNFMRGNLRKYQQDIQIAVTSEGLLKEPAF